MPDAGPPPAAEASSAAPPAPAALAESPATPRRQWYGNILIPLTALAVAGAIVVLFATQWDRWVGTSVRQVTDDAYVRGDITPLSAKVEGYVTRVAIDDFDRVKTGDLLVQIDDSDYQ